ncbi:MAG: MFS transporter [Oceanicaulis sp.]
MGDRFLIRLRRAWRLSPFTAYMLAVSGWFFSFGLQTTLFPGVINYTLLESPDRLGMAQAALTAPMLFILPLAGVLAERVDRRAVMAGFHVLACSAAAGLALLLFRDQLSYELLIAYALVVGLAGAFVMPARDSAVNPVTRVTQRMGRSGLSLQRAVVLASLVQFAAQLAGMGAGLLAAFFGPGPLFAVQGMGLLLGALAALMLPRLHAKRRDAAPIWTSLREGVATVVSSSILLPMTLIMMAVGFLVVGGGFFVIVPVLVRDVYGGGYALLAGLMMCFWTGAFFANVLLARHGVIEKPGQALMAAQMATVVSYAAIALSIPLPAFAVLVFVWGLGGGVAISLSRAVVQEHAPANQVARVMSVYQLGLFGGMPAGAFAMGLIVDAVGARTAALVPMAGLLLVLIVIAVSTPILKVRRVDPG